MDNDTPTVTINRFQAMELGLDVTAPQFAMPACSERLGLCIGCGGQILRTQAYQECRCWSSERRALLYALVHTSCLHDMQREW